MSVVYFIFQQTMLFTIPLMIVALGGMFSERSGVVNIALEGILTMGAFTGILFLNMTGGKMGGQFQLALATRPSAARRLICLRLHLPSLWQGSSRESSRYSSIIHSVLNQCLSLERFRSWDRCCSRIPISPPIWVS